MDFFGGLCFHDCTLECFYIVTFNVFSFPLQMVLVSVAMLSFKQGDEKPNISWLLSSSAWWRLRWAFYIVDPTHVVFTSWPGKAPRREGGSVVRFGNVTGDEEIQPCCLATGRQDLTRVVGSGVEEGGGGPAHLVSWTVCCREDPRLL